MKIYNFELNKIYKDEFGRISAILALRKPAKITSHDLVDRVRQKLKTRRVGHAGALDPIATGIMIILVGKATKLSQKLLNMDKEYEFDILLGVSTDTQDPEGKIIQVNQPPQISRQEIRKVIQGFVGSYQQTVPIFSSIRINGIRLRELAHASTKIEKFKKENEYFVKFAIDRNKPVFQKLLREKRLDEKDEITMKLPKRPVEIFEATVKDIKLLKGKDLKIKNKRIKPADEFPIIKLIMKVSKGTYIRQLAEDIGEKLGKIPAMLHSLERTKIGKIGNKDVTSLGKVS